MFWLPEDMDHEEEEKEASSFPEVSLAMLPSASPKLYSSLEAVHLN